jgi:hypothetical protein
MQIAAFTEKGKCTLSPKFRSQALSAAKEATPGGYEREAHQSGMSLSRSNLVVKLLLAASGPSLPHLDHKGLPSAMSKRARNPDVPEVSLYAPIARL